jgi:hypothetical protein
MLLNYLRGFMTKRTKESIYYALFSDTDKATAYVAVMATSANQALENARKQFPECDRVVSERDFDTKTYTDELLRIRAENQAVFDDF